MIKNKNQFFNQTQFSYLNYICIHFEHFQYFRIFFLIFSGEFTVEKFSVKKKFRPFAVEHSKVFFPPNEKRIKFNMRFVTDEVKNCVIITPIIIKLCVKFQPKNS